MKDTENLVGKKLGDYILREKLTSGGMAHIYLGDDEKLQRRAAIKILTADIGADDNVLRERFTREARAIAQLEHDNIVPVYQFDQHENLYFIAMRYIEGNDLADEIKKYKNRNEMFPIERALYILEQTAAALDHAHKRGIIHRDVKPSNILLGDNDKAVLSDFGLVLWEDVDKTLGTAFGTPRYISPEQATDSQSAVPQSDIYSLAVIVYEIVTGKSLFTGNTPMEVALSHITEPPTPPRAHNPDVPANAQTEILKALQKDAKRRHETALEFIDALKQAYDVDFVIGTKPPIAPKTAPSKSKDSVATQPLRDDAPSTLPLSDSEILDTWDKIPSPAETKAQSPSSLKGAIPPTHAEKPKAKSGGLPLPLIGGGVLAVVIIIAVVVMMSGGNGASNDGTVAESGNLTLHYNEDFFAIVNTSENATLDISNLQISGDNGENSSSFGSSLEPGDCVWVHSSGTSPSALPDEFACDGNPRRVETNLYWWADDANDKSFKVKSGNRNVKTCDTVGRAVSNLGNEACTVNWSG